MKVLYDSLDAMLGELRDRRVEVMRVSRLVHAESGRPTAGIPHLTARVIVTAAVDEHLWAEWRLWVGQSVAEVGERGLLLPERLRVKSEQALGEIAERVEAAGFRVREGVLTHDGASLDSFRL